MLFAAPFILGCSKAPLYGDSSGSLPTREHEVVDNSITVETLAAVAKDPTESVVGQPAQEASAPPRQLPGIDLVIPTAAWIPFGEQSDQGNKGFPTVPLDAFPAPQPAPVQLEIPLQGQLLATDSVQANGPLITLSVRDAPLHSVLSLIANQQGISIVAASDLAIPVSVTLQPMPLESAMDALMAISGCTWSRVNEVIYVTEVKKDAPENFLAQGRVLRVFTLNYLAANDLEKVVTGLLSPVGKVFAKQTDVKDKRKATEQIVVEDLQAYADRVASYIAQVDRPPQQVVVEVRMLQVKLEDDTRHGINFEKVARLAGADVTLSTQSLATGVGQAAMFTVDGSNFDTLLDCLSTTNDTKTLAAPKLLMINGQESKIQIGRRLGYFVTTTTQTSTLQDVQFLEVGVVLTVTPQISTDGQVLLKVRPKVSSGDINPTTTLPEEETTEVDTSIMVPDGFGVIIGGLIQEVDNERQSKVPFLGDVWLVGRLFQRRAVERHRSEVVVALLPRIVPLGNCATPSEMLELQRVASPLLTPTLQSAPRPEPELKDAINNPSWAPRKWRGVQ
jgi:type II secretory pathway component GspD/PulD (secretin)